MKIYDLRKKDGTPIKFPVYDRYIYHETTSELLPDALYSISAKYNKVNNIDATPVNKVFIPTNAGKNTDILNRYKWVDYPSPNNNYDKLTVTNYNNEFYYAMGDITGSIKPAHKSSFFFNTGRSFRNPVCILRDNGTSTTSDYGYTYNDLKNMLNIYNDYDQYIQNNDYIELVIDNKLYHMRFNIDTYYGYSNKESIIPHHIDMISDEVLHFGQPQFLDIWDKTLYSTPTKSIAGNGSSDNIFKIASDKLWKDVQGKLNTALKARIIPKTAIIYDRYLGNPESFISNNDISLGYLWQLREAEIFGYSRIGNLSADANTCIQYPSCRYTGVVRFSPQGINSNTTKISADYITWSLLDRLNASICINKAGNFEYDENHQNNRGKLLCFRFT